VEQGKHMSTKLSAIVFDPLVKSFYVLR
jgi:hypothetical protein